MIEGALRLNQIIKQSEEYTNYVKALKGIKDDPDLYEAMNSYRKRNFELQSYDDGVNRYHEIHNLCQEYEKILRNPSVNDFLLAEQVFSRKMAEVYEQIADGLELDYSYME